MLELVILVVAVVVLALVLRRPLEWLYWRRFDELHPLEWETGAAAFYAELALSRPSAHAIITGITS